MHAHAMDDPIFEATYAVSSIHDFKGTQRLCLRCHAPLSLHNRDPEKFREGVTCDFCHSVVGVMLSNTGNPYLLGRAEGPSDHRSVCLRSNSGSPSSPVLSSSVFCAGCHEYAGKNDFPIMGTYSEWKESSYAGKGVHCQDCHMPLTSSKIRDHRMMKFRKLFPVSGNRNQDSLRFSHETGLPSIRTEIRKVDRRGGHLTVVVRLTNQSAGHLLPTGIPSRRLVLVCKVKPLPGGEVIYRRKSYRKRMVERASGREFADDAALLLKEGRILEDNRLAPDHPLTETFRFLVDPDRELAIHVETHYLYRPVLIQKTEMRVHVSGDEARVPATESSRH